MNAENKNIQRFLQSACRFISTEERAIEIQDELRDHIYSYIEEYKNDGISEESAVNMALKNMGDPNTLSKSYRDKTYKYKRLFHVFFVILLLSVNAFSMILYDRIAGINLSITVFAALFINVFFALDAVSLIKALKKDKELSKVEPIFYIKSYKTSTWDEKAVKFSQIFLAGIVILILINYITSLKSGLSNGELDFLSTIDYITILLYFIIAISMYSPKGKNAIVYNDGILTYQSFTPWENIQGYRLDKELIKSKSYYSLVLSLKKEPKFAYKNSNIKISSSQLGLIEALFKNKNIKSVG